MTADKQIRRKQAEREAVQNAQLRLIVIAASNQTEAEAVCVISKHRNSVLALIRDMSPPYIISLTRQRLEFDWLGAPRTVQISAYPVPAPWTWRRRQTVRRNGGAAGVDGETVQRIEAQGVERWLGELARDLKEGSYRPGAVRQVLIPKKQAGKYRALGIPCVRDRVAQTAALVVLAPIFEADLEPEQYAYREGCSE